jgi:tetratricopeptide (TPR) repeat protein
MSEIPFALRLPAVFLRYWSDPSAESYAESIAAPFLEIPGVRRAGPRLLAVLPIPGDPGEVGTALRLAERLIADYRRQLPARRRGEPGTGLGVVVLPGWVRVMGRSLEREPEPLLEDLLARPPALPRDRAYLTGYAGARIEARWTLVPAQPYEGDSGTRVPLFTRGEIRPDARPWHNARVLRRTLPYQPRPEIEPQLLAHRGSPLLRVSGPLGCGKTRVVWQTLGPESGEVCIWVPVPPRRAGESLAARLLRLLACVAGEGKLGPGLIRLRLGALEPWLTGNAEPPLAGEPAAMAELTGRAVAATTALASAPLRLVFGDLHAAAAEDLALLAELLDRVDRADRAEGPGLAGARVVLVGRSRASWSAAFAEAPEVVVPPMPAAGFTALAEALSSGLDMPAEVRQRLAESAAGFPLALEEDLARMIQSRQLRPLYGSFFYGGSKDAEPEPSARLVQILEAEAGALGAPLAVRLLAIAGVALPPREIAAAAFSLGAELPSGWEEPLLAAGWLHRTRSPWGPGVDLSVASYARAFAHTVPDSEVPGLKRVLGEILAEVGGEPAGLWHAYRLLSGSAEAMSAIVDLAKEQPAAVPPARLLAGLTRELAAHRARGGEVATERKLLWMLLPLARRLGRLPQHEHDLDRALELAGDEPRQLLALAGLKAELDLLLGRFAEGEKTVRGVLDKMLAADPVRQGQLLLQLGRLLARQGRQREARELFERLEAAALGEEREPLAANCRFHLGNIALFEQRLEDAVLLHRSALAARRREGNLKAVGASLSALGAVALALGRYPEAQTAFAEAQEVLAEHGEEGEESFALFGLGRACSAMGDRTAAARYLRRALALREGRSDLVGEAVARLAVAANHLDLQQADKAAAEARLAHFHLSLATEGPLLGDAEQLLGRIDLYRRRPEAAAAHFAAALEIHQRHGDAAASLLDRGWQLEVQLVLEDPREVKRLTRELVGKVNEVPAGQRAAFAYRLACGLDWLRTRDPRTETSAPYLERAYNEILDTAGRLAPDLRHRYLFEITEHAAILAAATSQNLVA